MKYKIGLDVSGGDFAPDEIIKGAIAVRNELGEGVVLIGPEAEIKKALAAHKGDPQAFTIVDAPEKIEMAESPAQSVRRKKNSSIVIGADLLKTGDIDAFVSCGNTGAVVCAATLKLRMIEGVERPGIGVLLPSAKGPCLIVDVGANIDPKPLHLFHYGIMASVYYNLVLETENPTIGLLNVGEEESKGSELVKHAHGLFSSSPLNFVGNLEPGEMFSGRCNCIVCAGFVGNVVLKVSEGAASFIGRFVLGGARKTLLGKLGLFLLRKRLLKFKRMADYAEYGGAPLLGVDGVVIIGHGRSTGRAITNAVKAAVRELDRGLIAEIHKKVSEVCPS